MKNRASIIRVIGYTLILMAVTTPAHAADGLASWRPDSFGGAILSTMIFGIIGIILSITGFKLFDLMIRFNLEKEICENKNIAAAILAGAVILGVCIVVAAAIV